MEFIIKHRCVGEWEQEPSEYIIDAETREDAIIEFWEAHWDLNAMIVEVVEVKP